MCAGQEFSCNTSDATGSTSFYCSFGGSCLGSSASTSSSASTASSAPPAVAAAAAVVIAPPSIVLNGPATVSISLNSTYKACIGSSTSNCDLGATATQTTTGDLNGMIRACSTLAPTSNPSPYAIVGLLYCGINSMVPGLYTITYSVSGRNGTSASVQRSVVVLSTCTPGLQQCSDGSCGKLSSRSVFLSHGISYPDLSPPLLTSPPASLSTNSLPLFSNLPPPPHSEAPLSVTTLPTSLDQAGLRNQLNHSQGPSAPTALFQLLTHRTPIHSTLPILCLGPGVASALLQLPRPSTPNPYTAVYSRNSITRD